MKLKSNFSLGLDFRPLLTWPSTLPAVALGNDLISGFDLPSDHSVYCHPFENFEASASLLKSLYPVLTLPELSRLFHSAAFGKYFGIESLLKAYHFQFSPDSESILKMIATFSVEFQSVISDKKMSFQEFEILLCLSNDHLQFVQNEVLKTRESRQEIAKRIEYLTDLLQFGKMESELRGLSLSELYRLRFPVTSGREQDLAQSELPWHSQIKPQLKRRGDKAGFEIHFFAGTPAELSKLAQNLSKVAQEWNNHS